MKKEIWLVVLIGSLFSSSIAVAQLSELQKRMMKQMRKKMWSQVLGNKTGTQSSTPTSATPNKAVRGKALFNDSLLGTNGKSCGSCHIEGKKPLDGRKVDNRTIASIQYHYEHSIAGEKVITADKLDKLIAYFNSLARKKSGSKMFPASKVSPNQAPQRQPEMEEDEW